MELELLVEDFDERGLIVRSVNRTLSRCLGTTGWESVKYMIKNRYKIDADSTDLIEQFDSFEKALTGIFEKGTIILIKVITRDLQLLGSTNRKIDITN
ncbi:MAG: hypothetical protein HYY67_03255 [Thaumarchaeota archaeon]|nr:hypothetical protein [Nitrososphaerota archaeon]